MCGSSLQIKRKRNKIIVDEYSTRDQRINQLTQEDLFIWWFIDHIASRIYRHSFISYNKCNIYTQVTETQRKRSSMMKDTHSGRSHLSPDGVVGDENKSRVSLASHMNTRLIFPCVLNKWSLVTMIHMYQVSNMLTFFFILCTLLPGKCGYMFCHFLCVALLLVRLLLRPCLSLVAIVNLYSLPSTLSILLC